MRAISRCHPRRPPRVHPASDPPSLGSAPAVRPVTDTVALAQADLPAPTSTTPITGDGHHRPGQPAPAHPRRRPVRPARRLRPHRLRLHRRHARLPGGVRPPGRHRHRRAHPADRPGRPARSRSTAASPAASTCAGSSTPACPTLRQIRSGGAFEGQILFGAGPGRPGRLPGAAADQPAADRGRRGAPADAAVRHGHVLGWRRPPTGSSCPAYRHRAAPRLRPDRVRPGHDGHAADQRGVHQRTRRPPCTSG